MSFQIGDWVQTKSVHRGKILLVSRLSAFAEILGHDELRATPHLLSELTKIESKYESFGNRTNGRDRPSQR